MKYLAGPVKDNHSIIALCEPGRLIDEIDADAAYLRDDVLSHLTLLRHQRAVVPRLILLEAQQSKREDGGASIASNTICYCDNFGTGKTRTMIAMIAIAPLPLTCTPQTLLSAPRNSMPVRILVKNLRPNGRMTTNMIIVKSDVLGAWLQEIALLPELRVLRIASVFDYNEFIRIITSPSGIGKMNSFDIMLVKFGTMALNGAQVSIVDSIAQVLRDHNVVLARVIMDDFDQWKKIAGVVMPDASSYIAVSTTRDNRKMYRAPARNFIVFDDILTGLRPTVEHAIATRAIAERRIRCEDDFVKESVNIPALCRWIVDCEDHKGIIAELFGNTEDPNTARALEAFNGDAVKTTARLLNISATTPADIYAALMRGKETAVIRAKERLNRCFSLKRHIAEVFRAMVDKNVPSITSIEIDTIEHWLRSDAVNIPPHILPRKGIIAVLDKHIEEATEEETLALREINIVREMLARCCCDLCKESVGSDPASETARDGIVMQCCGKIVCRDCFTRASSKKIVCPLNAKHEIGTKQIVFLSGRIDFANVVESAPDSNKKLVKFDVVPDTDNAMAFEDIVNHKMRALMCIIHGEPIIHKHADTTPLPPGVVVGEDYREVSQPRKVIVFARENETIENIQGMFENRMINYATLGGSYVEIQNKIKAFREDPEMRVLLIQSERHASGINLQFATDLVFYHRMTEKETYRQATGRIQRFGRTCSGTIWRLKYEGEQVF